MHRHPLFLAYLALTSVCFFWGTTYLGIRMALESLPPLVLMACRFTVSGALMLVGARLAGLRMPSAKDALSSAACGLLALGMGNLCLSYAELWIPSSLAALFVTTSPFWMVALDAAWKGGERLRMPIVIGMLIGFSGVAMLVGPDTVREGLGSDTVHGFLLLQLGCLSWSLGSIAQRRHVRQLNAVVSGAIQQLAVGLATLVPAVFAVRDVKWDSRAIAPVAYLVVFGSIVGYTSYVYVLKHLPVSVVTIHVYVNPLVAGVLGWFFYNEPFGRREAMAMGVILAGVAVVRHFGSRPPTAALREAAAGDDGNLLT